MAKKRQHHGATLAPAFEQTNTAFTKPAPPATIESLATLENLALAWDRVRSNHGAPGVDNVTIECFDADFTQRLPAIQSDLLAETYRPHPVRVLHQRKRSGDGFRTLGIPTVRDRLVLQALSQVLAPIWESTFSPNSFGYRPGRSAHDAIRIAQQWLQAGQHWVVDLDVEGFFDHVDHVRLMLRLSQRTTDVRLLDLIADFLRAGRRLPDNSFEPTRVGIAQGSPLSPLMANIVLDELDQEYTRLCWQFVRYADDCILVAKTENGGQRMLDFTTRFLDDRLRLKLNPHKTRIVPPNETCFLGFTYRVGRYGRVRRGVSRHALDQFKERVSILARPRQAGDFREIVAHVAAFVRGWSIYFGFSEDATMTAARAFARERLRLCVWELWRTPEERTRQLIQRGITPEFAEAAANALHLADEIAELPVLAEAFPDTWFDAQGLGNNPPRPSHPSRRNRSCPSPLIEYLCSGLFRRQLKGIATILRGSVSATNCYAEGSPLAKKLDALNTLATIYASIQNRIGSYRLPDIGELRPLGKSSTAPQELQNAKHADRLP